MTTDDAVRFACALSVMAALTQILGFRPAAFVRSPHVTKAVLSYWELIGPRLS